LWTDFDEIFWRGRAWLKDQVIQFWWRSGSRFGSGSPKSEIRILRIGGGLCSLSTSSLLLFFSGAEESTCWRMASQRWIFMNIHARWFGWSPARRRIESTTENMIITRWHAYSRHGYDRVVNMHDMITWPALPRGSCNCGLSWRFHGTFKGAFIWLISSHLISSDLISSDEATRGSDQSVKTARPTPFLLVAATANWVAAHRPATDSDGYCQTVCQAVFTSSSSIYARRNRRTDRQTDGDDTDALPLSAIDAET